MSQVRVGENTHEVLRSLSTKEGKSMQDIIERAVEDYRRKKFLEGLNGDFEALHSDSTNEKDYTDELRVWDSTSTDGLED